MSIRVKCPDCREVYLLSEELLGKSVRCKKCSRFFPVAPPPEGADGTQVIDLPVVTFPVAPPVSGVAVHPPQPQRSPTGKAGLVVTLLLLSGAAALVLFLGIALGGGWFAYRWLA